VLYVFIIILFPSLVSSSQQLYKFPSYESTDITLFLYHWMGLNEVKYSFVTALVVSSFFHKPELAMCINWTEDKNYTQNDENPTPFFVYPKTKLFYLYACSSDPWQYGANFLSFAFFSRGQRLWLVVKVSQSAEHYLDVTDLIIELFLSMKTLHSVKVC
jgi:hypothetical protein